MTSLPQPDDLTSLVLRVDFSDDAAWESIRAELDEFTEGGGATCVDDPEFEGVSIGALIEADAVADEEEQLTYLFLAGKTSMTDDEHPLLAVDLFDEPGRTFRVPPRWFVNVSANLCIANMDFAEYADEVDDTGTFRGFE